MEFDEEDLIIEVEKYRVLYDLSHPRFYDSKVKEKAWQEISERLNTEAEACKKRWKALRECFRKSKLRRKTGRGQEGKQRKPWKYEKEMSFLDLWKDSRDQLSNVSSGQEEDADDGDSVVIDNVQNTQATTSLAQDAQDPLDWQSESSSELSAIKSQKKRPLTSAEVLPHYLDAEEDERESKLIKHDHIRQFFASSEAIFRMLPAEEQIDARVEITQLLAKYEKRVLLNRSSPPRRPTLQHPQNSASDEYKIEIPPYEQ